MAEMFWLPVRSIWLAIIMMWRRPDHTTSKTRAVGHGRLADQLGRRGGEGRCAHHQGGLAVGQHEVGREGELGQPGTERRDGAERADHDLARLRARPRRRR